MVGGEIGNLVPWDGVSPHCVGGSDLGGRRGDRNFVPWGDREFSALGWRFAALRVCGSGGDECAGREGTFKVVSCKILPIVSVFGAVELWEGYRKS